MLSNGTAINSKKGTLSTFNSSDDDDDDVSTDNDDNDVDRR